MNPQLLVLASGPADNFAQGLYPRNLYEIDHAPLLAHVIDSFAEFEATTSSVLLRSSEHQQFATGNVVNLLSPHSTVLAIPDVTSGAAGSALWAIDTLDHDAPLIVANGDIVLTTPLRSRILSELSHRDATVVTFESVHPRWSYVALDDDGLVVRAREKHPISKTATVGIYAYARAGDFFHSIQEMILKDDTFQGKFYVCPSLNQLILRGLRISTVPEARHDYFSLATPDGVGEYLRYRTSTGVAHA